jgi:hypothetical protein
MQIFMTHNIPQRLDYQAVCPSHRTVVEFAISALEMVQYRGGADELIRVAAHQAVLAKCDGCKREQVPSLPEAS